MFRPFVLSTLLASFFCAAQSVTAQTSVYGAVALVNYGYQIPHGEFYSHPDTIGFTGGATWLVPSFSRLKIGIDGRFDGSPGSHGGEAGLASLRVAFVPRHDSVSPYFQIGGGYEATDRNLSTTTEHMHGGVVDLAVGLNVRTGPHVFLRPIELMGSGGSNVAHVSLGIGVGYTFGDRQ